MRKAANQNSACNFVNLESRCARAKSLSRASAMPVSVAAKVRSRYEEFSSNVVSSTSCPSRSGVSSRRMRSNSASPPRLASVMSIVSLGGAWKWVAVVCSSSSACDLTSNTKSAPPCSARLNWTDV